MYEEFVHKEYIETEKKHSQIYNNIDRYFFDAGYDFSPRNKAVISNKTIWIMWYQGLENAPPIIKGCVNSVERNRPDGYEIIFITKDNINNYINIPSFISDKLDKGVITLTHFSDIVRLLLLVAYGGLWIDATVFVCDKIPQFMCNDLFMFRGDSVVADPVIKISSWWIYAKTNDYIMTKVLETLLNYWESETMIADYFLFHLIISKIIDIDGFANAKFKKMPSFSNLNAHYMSGLLETEYSSEKFEIIKKVSPVQKLSYKNKIIRGDIYSFYDAIVGEDI